MRRPAVCIVFLLYCLIMPSVSIGEDFYESQLNSGIKNSDVYAYLLIDYAREHKTDAKKILDNALYYSPDLPAVYFELAKANFTFSKNGVLNSVDHIVQGIDAYSRNFWWSFTLTGSFFFSLILSFISSIIIIVVVKLLNDIQMISHDLTETNSKAFLLLPIVVLSIISPLFLLAGLLILIGLYMKKFDRIIVYLFLIFLLFSPIIFKTASLFINSFSGSIKSIVQVNESKGNNYAIDVLKNNNDYAALFSYALALKREARFDKAIAIYEKLARQKVDPKVYVNLANCYVGLYNFEDDKKHNLEESIRYYLMAVNMKPLVSAYYNLSQISREMLDFTKGDEYFKKALALNRIAVSEYRTIYGRTPNRLVADAPIDFAGLWKYAIEKSKRVSTFSVTIIPPILMTFISLMLIAGFYMLKKNLKHTAYKCRRCSTILCTKCEKHLIWGQMCPQCYSSLVKLDELDAKERVAKLLSIYSHQKKRRDIMKILSFILPGSSQIYSGKILFGFIFLWPFLFFLFIPFTNSIFITDNSLLTHNFIKWTAILIALALYVASNLITRERISKGWL